MEIIEKIEALKDMKRRFENELLTIQGCISTIDTEIFKLEVKEMEGKREQK